MIITRPLYDVAFVKPGPARDEFDQLKIRRNKMEMRP